MATLAKLLVQLGLDDDGFSKGLAGTKAKLNSWGQSLTTAGAAATAGLTLPILAGAGKAVMAASDLGEAVSATQTIYGKSAASVIAWGKTTANAYGISNAAALSSVNTLGQLYKGAGVTADQAGKFGMSIVGAAGDLASFYDLPTSQTLADLQSGIVGQYEPLQKYGISINEAEVAQRALIETGKASVDQLTEAEKVTARQSLIMEGLGDAAGDSAKTHNSLANIIRRVQARGTDLAAKWGKMLLPTAQKLGMLIERVITRLENLSPRMQKLAAVGVLVAAAIGPVLLIIGQMLPAMALLLGPVGLLVVAVGLLGVAFATNFLGIRDAAGAVISTMAALGRVFALAFGEGVSNKQLLDLFPDSLKGVAEGALKIVDAFGDLYRAFQEGGVSGLFAALPGEISQAWRGVKDLVGAGFDLGKIAISATLERAGDLAGNIWDWVKGKLGVGSTGGMDAADRAVGAQTIGLGSVLVDGALGLGSYLAGIAADFGGWLWPKIKGAWDGLLKIGAIGIDTGGDVVPKIVSKLGDLGTGLKTWYDQAIASVKWNELGQTVGTRVGNLARTLAPKAAELIKGMTDWFWQHKEDIGKGVLALIIAAPAAIGYVGKTLGPKALDFLQGFVDGLDINWKVVSDWLGDIPDKVKGYFLLAGTWLLLAGLDVINGLKTGIDLAWFLAKSSVTNAIQWIKDQFLTALNWLNQAGQDIFTGLANGLEAVVSTPKQKITDLISWVLTQFVTAKDWLLQAGKDILQGLIDGLDEKLGPLRTIVGTIKDIIDGMLDKIGLLKQGINDVVIGNGGSGGGGGAGGGFEQQSMAFRGVGGGLGGGGIVVPITINGNVYGEDDFVEQVARKLIPAIAGAAGAHFSANGAG